MDDSAFKHKYQKYKLRVKVWEKDFRKKNGRVPSKYDIREAPEEIRASYKMYYKLKTSFLEDTLNDVLSEDGFDVFEMSQTEGKGGDGGLLDDSFNECVNGGPQLPLDISAIINGNVQDNNNKNVGRNFSNLNELPTLDVINNLVNRDENHVISKFEVEKELPLNENAWGRNVSKKEDADSAILKSSGSSMTSKPKTPNLRASLNPNNFQNTSGSFAKRNPRKPLSRKSSSINLKNSNTFETNSEQQVEQLPDLETILINKAKEHKQAAAIATNPLLVSADRNNESLKTKLDEGWLERNSLQNGTIKPFPAFKDKESETSIHTGGKSIGTPSTRKTTYGLSNLDVTKFVNTSTSTDVPPVAPNVPTVVSPVPNEVTVLTAIETKSSTNIEATPEPSVNLVKTNSQVSIKVHKKIKDSESEDSVVGDSDEEKESQEYRHIVKRRRVMASGSEISISQPSDDIDLPSSEATMNLNNSEGKDFSIDTDEEKDDATYVPSKAKSKPKKATGKTRTESVKREVKPKEKKVSKPRLPRVKAEKKPQVEKKTRLPRKTKAIEDTTEIQETEPDDAPLNPEELKYALALESGSITSVPRFNLTELERVDNVAQNYINNFTTNGPSKVKPKIAIIDEKRAAARKKLEEKIATGKLNENFVTINIEKKKYARGKKSVNYSKYKKQQWRHKKRIAALSGPDMDMGGCDGGVLTCFSCGGIGHFAQNCKVKGDSLLPLSAQIEEDPSPFPTLEEAEQMASQSALAVHSRNIAKLPQAPNSAIYRNQVKDNSDKKEENDEDTGESKEEDFNEKSLNDDDSENSEHKLSQSDSDDDDDNEFNQIDFAELDAVVERSTNLQKSPIKNYVGHKIPEDFLKKVGLDETNSASKLGAVGALYDLNPDGSVKDVTPEVLNTLRMFGHSNFRKGQDRAVMRILSGLSTLVTLSTGSGKSLCYQLPAYLYSRQKKSITLVISPLVSLMEDQVTGVPNFLRAHCLHTNQTPQQRLKVQKMIADGEVDILLVSPEAVVSGEKATGFGAILRQLPPIAFACIDEAHCVSQWSHNFRPSYLMICKVLKKNLGVQTVLGLTATATLPTRMSIINHLGITDGERGVISDIPLPDNLILSISKDENRDQALLGLLNSPRFKSCQSVIIYCTRRDECERIAAFIRTCIRDGPDNGAKDSKKRKRVNWQAEPYHAGLPASRRRTIQNAFMKNELRIVVATIAFGMGINKPDIRAVIHYNMPRNFESYVQEVGRAGRDGLISHCHLFLAPNDQNELRRHIYANSLDRHVIRKLLQRIFVPCACATNAGKEERKRLAPVEMADASDFGDNQLATVAERTRICPGHEIGFSIEKTVEALDIPSENISTLLCYLELDTRWAINVLSAAYINAKVISYGGPKFLKHAAKGCPPLAMAIALKIKNKTFDEDANIIEFSVVDIAAAIGWNSGVVKYQLKNLEWIEINGYSKRSTISVSFTDLGFRLKAPGDFLVEEIDDALDNLYNRAVKQETTQLIQLQYVFQGLSAVAYNTHVPCTSEDFPTDRSEQLKGIIRNYFRNDYPKNLQLEEEKSNVSDQHIIDDIHCLINLYPDNTFSGRNIARIFHGIPSPNFPAVIWGRCKYWRVHSKTNFNYIVQLGNSEIFKLRRMQ